MLFFEIFLCNFIYLYIEIYASRLRRKESLTILRLIKILELRNRLTKLLSNEKCDY